MQEINLKDTSKPPRNQSSLTSTTGTHTHFKELKLAVCAPTGLSEQRFASGWKRDWPKTTNWTPISTSAILLTFRDSKLLLQSLLATGNLHQVCLGQGYYSCNLLPASDQIPGAMYKALVTSVFDVMHLHALGS